MKDYSVYIMDSVVSHKWPYNITSLSLSLYERERLFSPFEKGGLRGISHYNTGVPGFPLSRE
ncbi:MAG: hypothetical protein Q8P44_05195 [Dehalococcoidia bacterium]|nr:hypothetical protein [Dehalococcoidia bacterium]